MTENSFNSELDPKLAMLAAEIDKLALDDMPRAGLEDRIFASTLPVLQSAAAAAGNSEDAPRLVLTGTKARGVSTWKLHGPVRLAASLALLATVSAVWIANRPGATPGKILVPAAADDWAIVTNLFDDNDDLKQLATDTAGLDDRMKSFNVDDLILEEGAM